MRKRRIAEACILSIGFCFAAMALPPRYGNEWSFENDLPGVSLHDTMNTGTLLPLARFEAGSAETIFTTNWFAGGNVLLCTGQDETVDKSGGWSSGARLDAPVAVPGEVHYLRYDVHYDWRSMQNNGVFGVYFSESGSGRMGGVALGKYNEDSTFLDEGPDGERVRLVAEGFSPEGSLTAIAEVNLSQSPVTLKIWYTLDGSSLPDYGAPNAELTLSLSSIDALRFHATGDMRPAGTEDYVAVDNIRHTVGDIPGGAAWDEIVEPLVDLTAPPALTVEVSDSLGGAMDVGETNIVSVVVGNPVVEGRAHPVTDVGSTLTHDGGASAFTVVPSVIPADHLRGGESTTNTYQIISLEQGRFSFKAVGQSVEATSEPAILDVVVGRNLGIEPVTSQHIREISGGIHPGMYEPGETLEITVTTINDGALPVLHTLNSLDVPSGFTARALDSQVYGILDPGERRSTTYEVVIGTDTPLGVYPIAVVNAGSGQEWTSTFNLTVSTRPATDWVKADNALPLDDPASWVRERIPDATATVILDETVTAPIETDLGQPFTWRGIALASNVVDWTIHGIETLTLGGGGIDMTQARGDLRLDSRVHLSSTQTWDVAENRTLNVTGIVTGTNTLPLVKSGKGVLRMSHPANTTLRGGVRLEAGALVIANHNVLGRGDLSIGNATLATQGAASLTNRVELTGAAVFNHAHSLLLSGVISGPGSLVKEGNGRLILARENHFTGGTVIDGSVEIRDSRSLGTGPVVFKEGSRLRAGPAALPLSSPLSNPIELKGSVTFETDGEEDNSGLMVVTSPISGPGKLTLEGFQFYLQGENTFEGGIDLNHRDWLRITSDALGTGPLTTGRQALLLALESMEIENEIVMDHPLILHNANQNVVLSGRMSGSGQLQILYSPMGRLTITGDNRERTGSTIIRTLAVRLGNQHALGTGAIWLEPQFASFEIEVLRDLTGDQAMGNEWIINRTFMNNETGRLTPVRFLLSHDLELTGSFTQRFGVSAVPVIKEGSGTLILGGAVNVPGPLDIRDGALVVRAPVNCERITMAGGTVLSGRGAVSALRLQTGSTLHLKGEMTFEKAPEIHPGVDIVLDMVDTTLHGALSGTGGGALELGGTITLDFTDTTITADDEFHILRNWALLMDDGVQVVARNLRPDLALDTSRLFTEGRVRVVAGDAPAPPPIGPAERAKKDNDDDLNLTSSWVDAALPGPAHRARFDRRVQRSRTTSLGADLSWRGIAMVSNVVDWVITGNQLLTLGPDGIDMSCAKADLQIASRLATQGTQSWNITQGRRLTVAGALVSREGDDIVKTGEGRLVFPAGIARQMAGGLIVSNGTLAVSGGLDRLDELRFELGESPIGSGPIRFSDGTMLTTAGVKSGLGNPITIDEGSLVVNSGQRLLLGGLIGGSGGLVHSGSGVLRLAGANSYSGGTMVEGGSTLEVTHFRALGTGRLTLRDGSRLHGWLPSSENLPTDRTINNSIFLENGQAEIRNLADANQQAITFSGKIDGPGGLRVVVDRGRRDIHLTGHNTFDGNLEIFNRASNAILLGAGPQSLGRGDIVCLGPQAHLGFDRVGGGRIANRIDLTRGSMVFVPFATWVDWSTVEFAGEIFGAGSISFLNRPGTIRLIGDNRRWSGGISGIGSFNVPNGMKRLIVDHPNALGTGRIIVGGHADMKNYIEIHVRAPVATTNNLLAIHSGPVKTRKDLLVISRNSVFGKLDGIDAHQGFEKTGEGRMTLTAQGDYPSPFNVREGVLDLDSAGFPGKTTVFPGAGLVASSARTGPVRIRSGGTIEVKGGEMRVEGGALTLEGDAQMTLCPSDPTVPLLTGDGKRDLTLSGTLLIDFSAISPAAGDFVALFGGWNRIDNDGVTILASGLDDFMTLDTSTLFSDGRVRVIGGGRLGSQELSIRVTSGGSGSASVQVHNPENVTRYFRLKPGTEWPSWLIVAPNSARTAVGPGAQATVSVTANATGLPAGRHRFMLPVVWEHGVTDLILATVQVEGPSLSVVPGTLPLPVVENTTGEGMVDLINNGTLPVSYRIRRVLAEHEVYTQPAADVPWITVSPTVQTEITSFPSGRSTPRSIGFGFPFFGTTETEVSVGIDGTLWFGGKPAIRVFSNKLLYQTGFSKITTKSEADRFIVTWDRMVQTEDQAQQTFQAVLHRDGRIDLRYHTIVAGSAWQTAQIGLHGPVQWHPAQRPETLPGRTIRFARDPETARISIAQTSGTVAAGATQALTVTGDATGLSAGASRTALFAVDYDGGITGTAGEVKVTMDVVAAAGDPVADEIMDDLAPPFYPHGPDPVVVLNPPQRTGGGRRITWSVDGEHGGMQPSGTTVYRIETTTNLLSGSWEDLISVTNKLEYTDEQPMDGPVIFYRIVKEKE